jgi:hypothetical protein
MKWKPTDTSPDLILALGIFAFLCLFWGALFDQQKNVHKLKIWVVDFDSQSPPYDQVKPFVGPFVIDSVQRLLRSDALHPGYTIRSPADFDNDPLKVRQSVYDFHAWAAVIINANATAAISNAIIHGDKDYDPRGACQIIYNTARDQTTTASYIDPSLTVLQKNVVSSFGREWLANVLNTYAPENIILSDAPQAITPGIEFTMYDLRPFGPAIATPAVSIGLIYLIILSFFSFTFFLPIHMKYLNPRGHPPLHFTHLIVWRYVATVTSYFFLSLVYSLVSLAFLMPMNCPSASPIEPAANPNAYGRGTFPVYWMINWVGMCALGLASENMAMLLGTPWTALWLIFWVISNVATGFYNLELASDFYRWGYAWPIHNGKPISHHLVSCAKDPPVAELTRQTLFDLHPRTGQNFGILFAWVIIGTALFPICCFYMRWNTARTKRNAAQAELAWKEKMDREREEPSLLARVTTRGSRPVR